MNIFFKYDSMFNSEKTAVETAKRELSTVIAKYETVSSEVMI